MGEDKEARHEGRGQEAMAPQGLPQPGSPNSLADGDSPLAAMRGEKNMDVNFLPVVQTGVREAWDLEHDVVEEGREPNRSTGHVKAIG